MSRDLAWKKRPIAYGVAVILYHQRRIITICAVACGRQLIACQKNRVRALLVKFVKFTHENN